MFQNISRDSIELEQDIKEDKSELLQKLFTKQYIALYILAFMLSLVSGGIDSNMSPFSIAILAAMLTNRCTRRNNLHSYHNRKLCRFWNKQYITIYFNFANFYSYNNASKT